MPQDPDEDRIARKAHELWEAEGRPHGRDQDHWALAREIIAIEDSQTSTLLPRDTGAEAPVEPALAIDSLGDVPNLTDQGKDDLTDLAREPTFAPLPEEAPAAEAAPPAPALKAAGGKSSKAKTAGGGSKDYAISSKPLKPAGDGPASAPKRTKKLGKRH